MPYAVGVTFGAVGIADLAFGELLFEEPLHSVKFIKHVQRCHRSPRERGSRGGPSTRAHTLQESLSSERAHLRRQGEPSKPDPVDALGLVRPPVSVRSACRCLAVASAS